MSANCGASTVYCTVSTIPSTCRCKRQACVQQCPASTLQLWDLDRLLHVCTRERGATVGTKPSSPRLHLRNLLDCNQHQPPCRCTATGESQWSLKCDHGELSLRTDGDVDDHEEELQLRHLHCDASLDQGHGNLVQELHLWNGQVDWQHHKSSVEPSNALNTNLFTKSSPEATVEPSIALNTKSSKKSSPRATDEPSTVLNTRSSMKSSPRSNFEPSIALKTEHFQQSPTEAAVD